MTPNNPDRHDIALPPIAVIDALLDGEVVDKSALRTALDEGPARDYLIDALALRQLTRDMAPLTYVAPGTPAGPLARAMRWVAAIIVVAGSAAGGYKWGQHDIPSPTASVEAVTLAPSAPVAPTPTKVIRLEPGVNWTDTPGEPR